MHAMALVQLLFLWYICFVVSIAIIREKRQYFSVYEKKMDLTTSS